MNRLPGLAAVALIVVGGATSSASPTILGGPLVPHESVALSVSASSSPSPGLRTTPTPEPAGAPAGVVVHDSSAPAAQRSLPGPSRIRYPGIGADMRTIGVGVSPDGTMEIPDDAAVAGWYRYSAAPSEPTGNTIIAAHAGSIPTPRGPLYDLRSSRVGQSMEITDAMGATTNWKVTKVEQLHKTSLDLDPYFTGDGQRTLVLFTCGGRWDQKRQSYDDNIIVTAVPAG
ncbi:class F sortase [Paeniglutamicibacter cryotolerans]|uniref:Class F sortase n=1 Tax=Paeniglutamicibacter cryotolerans TaxID=670079 RepID=A0A839QRG1_9MICC|nr:class F sortase [Paeniglutamicibacter cryotolerans]MBB2995842.1 hypothetical protein [Paeniglutamicibacter cryotolerans]